MKTFKKWIEETLTPQEVNKLFSDAEKAFTNKEFMEQEIKDYDTFISNIVVLVKPETSKYWRNLLLQKYLNNENAEKSEPATNKIIGSNSAIDSPSTETNNFQATTTPGGRIIHIHGNGHHISITETQNNDNGLVKLKEQEQRNTMNMIEGTVHGILQFIKPFIPEPPKPEPFKPSEPNVQQTIVRSVKKRATKKKVSKTHNKKKK